jgi:SagB-type dehydrogenase family enzyme
MKTRTLAALVLAVAVAPAAPRVLLLATPAAEETMAHERAGKSITLPRARAEGPMPVERAIRERRSVRAFTADSLSLEEAATLLWAAQGVTHQEGLRAAPSAGGLYPLEVYLVALRVRGLAAGIYRYVPADHALTELAAEDVGDALCEASWSQDWMRTGAAILAVAAVYERTAGKYGARAERYVHMEVGGVAENVYLQATALGLGTTFVGAFDDAQVKKVLRLPAAEAPLCLLPVGRPR